MKKTFVQGLLAAALMAGAAQAGAQETKAPAGTPVEFAKGTSAATLKGMLKPGAVAVYTLGALSGQLLEVRLDPKSNALIKVVAPSNVETPLASVEQDGRFFSGRLPGTGQYLIQVSARSSAKAPAPYVLEVLTR